MSNENNPIDPTTGANTPAEPPRRRRAPRRDGKGANAATNQSALADQALIAEPSDEAAEKAGGVKLIANQRIIPFFENRKANDDLVCPADHCRDRCSDHQGAEFWFGLHRWRLGQCQLSAAC